VRGPALRRCRLSVLKDLERLAVRDRSAPSQVGALAPLTVPPSPAIMRRSYSTRSLLLCLLCVAPLARGGAQTARLDSLDAFVKAQMAQRNVRGVSLAIIKDGRIALARAYGVVDDSTRAPVTTSTLFQAGSVSKPVAALGALHLVENGTLALDADVNAKLRSWKVPDGPFTSAEKVTLRRLLSHTAGLNVHGFPGYDVAGPVPSLTQVLDGASPTNTAPIRVDTTPGAIWRYSGGGFTVMQQLVIDVTGETFPQFMQRAVLDPIGMTNSTFEQPLPSARAALTASGYYTDGTPVRGRWHVYPEMAAAGLWTTPTDLARFAIEIQKTLGGRGSGVVSQATARQYVTEQKNGYGLGVGVRGTGATLRFSHGGRDEGFDAFLAAGAESGDGVVIMMNANDNSPLQPRIRDYVERLWSFAGVPPTRPAPAATVAARIDPSRLAAYAGYYEVGENNMIGLAGAPAISGMQMLVDGRPSENLLAMDSVRFGSSERPFRLVLVTEGGRVTGATWAQGEPRERRAPRVSPLPSAMQPGPDLEPALTTRISTALGALRAGGEVLANATDVTAGAKRVFARGTAGLADVVNATYLGEEDVAGRGIRRHGSDVSRVRLYRMRTQRGERWLMVHLTAEGAVTDYDILLR
jgi:CubicO group peptidase (beta-lactamase class C family)